MTVIRSSGKKRGGRRKAAPHPSPANRTLTAKERQRAEIDAELRAKGSRPGTRIKHGPNKKRRGLL